MNARPRILVAAGSDTFALRLRLMLEAEGAEVISAPDCGPEVGVVVATPTRVDEAKALVPRARLVRVDEGEEWDVLRRRLADLVAAPEPTEIEPSEAEQMEAALARARILLVDDSVTYREFLRLELTRLGAHVTACANADEALAQVRQGPWDCMLVDLVMPGVDGGELCGRVARLRREHRLSFVLAVLSSREGKADLIRSLEAGADVFIGKSIDMPLFRAKLGALLRRLFLVQ